MEAPLSPRASLLPPSLSPATIPPTLDKARLKQLKSDSLSLFTKLSTLFSGISATSSPMIDKALSKLLATPKTTELITSGFLHLDSPFSHPTLGDGVTLLHVAATYVKPPLIVAMGKFQRYFDVNKQSPDGETAMFSFLKSLTDRWGAEEVSWASLGPVLSKDEALVISLLMELNVDFTLSTYIKGQTIGDLIENWNSIIEYISQWKPPHTSFEELQVDNMNTARANEESSQPAIQSSSSGFNRQKTLATAKAVASKWKQTGRPMGISMGAQESKIQQEAGEDEDQGEGQKSSSLSSAKSQSVPISSPSSFFSLFRPLPINPQIAALRLYEDLPASKHTFWEELFRETKIKFMDRTFTLSSSSSSSPSPIDYIESSPLSIPSKSSISTDSLAVGLTPLQVMELHPCNLHGGVVDIFVAFFFNLSSLGAGGSLSISHQLYYPHVKSPLFLYYYLKYFLLAGDLWDWLLHGPEGKREGQWDTEVSNARAKWWWGSVKKRKSNILKGDQAEGNGDGSVEDDDYYYVDFQLEEGEGKLFDNWWMKNAKKQRAQSINNNNVYSFESGKEYVVWGEYRMELLKMFLNDLVM